MYFKTIVQSGRLQGTSVTWTCGIYASSKTIGILFQLIHLTERWFAATNKLGDCTQKNRHAY